MMDDTSNGQRPHHLRFIVFPLLMATGIVLGFAGITLVSRYSGPFPLQISQTTTNKQSTFDVAGESKITTIPDRAEISLGITVNESTVKSAQDKANTVINNVKSELTNLGVDKKDIKTDSYSLYPQYDYQGGTQRITGYSVTTQLTVSLSDFSKLNQAIDAATKVGANQVSGISFTLSDDKKKEVEDQARAEAIENAKTKAETLAKLSGMHLGKIVNVAETPQAPMPIAYRGLAMESAKDGSAAGAPTNVEPGSTSYQYSVTLSYETN